MNIQPDLWHNADLETAYHRLECGALDEAAFLFEQSLHSPLARVQQITKLITECRDWWSNFNSLQEARENGNAASVIKKYLSDFLAYPFTESKSKIEKAVISLFAKEFLEAYLDDMASFTIIFDQHIRLKIYDRTLLFCKGCVARSPENTTYLLSLALAYTRSLQPAKGKKIYAKIFATKPSAVLGQNTSLPEFDKFLTAYGAARAYVFMFVAGVLPVVSLAENQEFEDEGHAAAIACYRLILQSEAALTTGNNKADVLARRQLQQRDSALFEAYMAKVKKSR